MVFTWLSYTGCSLWADWRLTRTTKAIGSLPSGAWTNGTARGLHGGWQEPGNSVEHPNLLQAGRQLRFCNRKIRAECDLGPGTNPERETMRLQPKPKQFQIQTAIDPSGAPDFAHAQRDAILLLLREAKLRGEGVDRAYLLFECRFTQCAARIFELERMGYVIRHETRPGQRYIT